MMNSIQNVKPRRWLKELILKPIHLLPADFAKPLAMIFSGPAWKYFGAFCGMVLMQVFQDRRLQDSVILSVILLGADTFMGITADWMIGHKFQAAKFRKSIAKFVSYSIVPAAILWSFKLMEFGAWAINAAVFATWLVIFTELKSILENAHKIGLPIPQFVIEAITQGIKRLNSGAKPENPPEAD